MWSTSSGARRRPAGSPTRRSQIGAKGVWFQLEIIDDEAYARTVAAGLDMVMNRCPAIELPRLHATLISRKFASHVTTAPPCSRVDLV